MVILKFEGKKLEDLDFWTKSDPYLTLSRPAKHGPGRVQVRRTETIWNNLNPCWKVLYIPVSELCDGDHQMTLTVEVYDEDRNSRDDLIGSVELSLTDLINLARQGSLVTLKKGAKNRGELLVRQCEIEQPSSDLERKESLSSYPPSRRESTYSMHSQAAPQSWSQPEQQAVPHQLHGQGPQQPCYPPYQPIPQYEQPGIPPYHQHNQGGPYSYQPFLPPIPDDPTDTRPAYVWT